MPSKKIMETKKQKVDELNNIFQSSGVFLFDYRGLTVPQMETLRNRVKETGANVRVIKNRLAIKYFENENKEYGRELFNGPLAAVYAGENFVDVAKIMVEAEKEFEKIDIKAGFIENTFADKNKIKTVSLLPNKDQLKAQLAFAMSMPIKKMGMALKAPLRDMLILMNNLKDKKEEKEEN